MKWDWNGFAFPKGDAKPTAKEGRSITDQVFDRQRQICFAQGISPVCTGKPDDPHELIPRGAGGRKSLTNTVGVCRPCHDAAQGRVGGNLLVFDWKGKADGRPPRADIPGNVSCRWKRIRSHAGPEHRQRLAAGQVEQQLGSGGRRGRPGTPGRDR